MMFQNNQYMCVVYKHGTRDDKMIQYKKFKVFEIPNANFRLSRSYHYEKTSPCGFLCTILKSPQNNNLLCI